MNLQFYLEKLFNSEEYKKFQKENPEAFFCSAFFSIDKKGEENKQLLDFYEPASKKMFVFELNPIKLVPQEEFKSDLEVKSNFIAEKVPKDLDFNFEEIEESLIKKMEEEKINKKVEKILWSLQTSKGKNVLIGTIFISGLGLIKFSFDLDKKEIIEFKKKSFFDMMKIVKKGKTS